jgi:hypothetical protein
MVNALRRNQDALRDLSGYGCRSLPTSGGQLTAPETQRPPREMHQETFTVKGQTLCQAGRSVGPWVRLGPAATLLSPTHQVG